MADKLKRLVLFFGTHFFKLFPGQVKQMIFEKLFCAVAVKYNAAL